MKRLIVNISQLLTFAGPAGARAGREMGSVGLYRDGAVFMDEGAVVLAGAREEVMKHPDALKARVLDAGGRVVLPGFVDAHTHPVFAAPRLKDFELRARGKTYEEIAQEGGGIVSSLSAVRGASEERIVEFLLARAGRFLECGTTTIEAKTGYGLDLDSEVKALRALKRAGAASALEILPTFLGAHAFPPEYRGERRALYVELLCREMVPAAAKEGARFIDAFCERGYFTEEEAEAVLRAGAAAGLGVKLHADQITRSGGSRLAARLGAVSADHLDKADEGDFSLLKASGTTAVLVPGANHFLGLPEYPPARRIIEAGVPVALATDFNPGTCPCWNMQQVLSLAVTRMRMTPEEALCAATINGAAALGLAKTHGSLEPGKRADLTVMDCEDYREIPYWFGANMAAAVFKKGAPAHSTVELRV